MKRWNVSIHSLSAVHLKVSRECFLGLLFKVSHSLRQLPFIQLNFWAFVEDQICSVRWSVFRVESLAQNFFHQLCFSLSFSFLSSTESQPFVNKWNFLNVVLLLGFLVEEPGLAEADCLNLFISLNGSLRNCWVQFSHYRKWCQVNSCYTITWAKSCSGLSSL